MHMCWEFQTLHIEGLTLQARPPSTSCLCGVHLSTNSTNCLRPPCWPSGGSNDMLSIEGNTCPLTSGELSVSRLTRHRDSFLLKRFFPLQLPLNYQVFRHWLTAGSSACSRREKTYWQIDWMFGWLLRSQPISLSCCYCVTFLSLNKVKNSLIKT